MESDESLISEELKSMIGKELPSLTQTTEIEAGLVARFVEAVEHPNAMWVTEWESEEPAKEAKYKKGAIVPPSVLWTRGISFRGHHITPLKPLWEKKGVNRGVDAGEECEVFRPVRIGDVITARSRLSDVSEHESKTRGKLLVVVIDTTYNNQEDEVVGTNKQTIILWRG